jgi:hypothetical protein
LTGNSGTDLTGKEIFILEGKLKVKTLAFQKSWNYKISRFYSGGFYKNNPYLSRR